MRILGVDPGLEATGYGLIDAGEGAPVLVEAGLIRTEKDRPLSGRLSAVARALQELLDQRRPELVAVEDLYSHYKTPQPAILMGHVRGVVLATAALAGLPVVSYLPTRVKRSAVGRGHATKDQVARMVQTRLGLSASQVRADVTDALAVALCHADALNKAEAMG